MAFVAFIVSQKGQRVSQMRIDLQDCWDSDDETWVDPNVFNQVKAIKNCKKTLFDIYFIIIIKVSDKYKLH